ncbi:MAG: hypothetical protein WA364_29065 [Candidatus Nitrosopolaris sp.]
MNRNFRNLKNTRKGKKRWSIPVANPIVQKSDMRFKRTKEVIVVDG